MTNEWGYEVGGKHVDKRVDPELLDHILQLLWEVALRVLVLVVLLVCLGVGHLGLQNNNNHLTQLHYSNLSLLSHALRSSHLKTPLGMFYSGRIKEVTNLAYKAKMN